MIDNDTFYYDYDYNDQKSCECYNCTIITIDLLCLQKAIGLKTINEASKLANDLHIAEQMTQRCLLGYCQANILGNTIRLTFGKYNYRPLNITEGDKNYKSMLDNGIQRYLTNAMISILVDKTWIQMDSLTDKSDAGSQLPSFRWSESHKTNREVIAPGGRHRYHTVGRIRAGMMRTYEAAKQTGEKRKKAKVKAKAEGEVDEVEKLKETADYIGCFVNRNRLA